MTDFHIPSRVNLEKIHLPCEDVFSIMYHNTFCSCGYVKCQVHQFWMPISVGLCFYIAPGNVTVFGNGQRAPLGAKKNFTMKIFPFDKVSKIIQETR